MKQNQILAILAAIVVVAAGAIYFITVQGKGAGGGERARRGELGNAPRPTSGDSREARRSPPVAARGMASDLMVPGPLGDMRPRRPQGAGDGDRIRVDDLPALPALPRRDLPATFKEKYIDTGKVYFIFREFPLDPLALAAIMLARCAPKERYFPIVDLLFDTPADLGVRRRSEDRALQPRQAGRLHPGNFRRLPDRIRRSRRSELGEGPGPKKFGVNATPTFFINGKKPSGELSHRGNR